MKAVFSGEAKAEWTSPHGESKFLGHVFCVASVIDKILKDTVSKVTLPLAETLNSKLEIKMDLICFNIFLWFTFIQKMLICVIVCQHIIPISLFQYLPRCIVLHTVLYVP